VPFSLLRERWLPFRTRGGSRRWIAPPEIAPDSGADALVAPDWGRADFDSATLEFLIGLLATAYPPKDLRQWTERFKTPPPANDLAESFSSFAAAFELDGDGPRFMQDFEKNFAGETVPVSSLLIEAAGENAERNNTDLFQKRGQVTRLGLPAAAMALFTLQTYAPTGGAGHRTSLRGGGPLTTLALPPEDHDTFWRRLYLNVPDLPRPLPEDISQIFGWLAPTRMSENGRSTGPDDVHPLAAFWGAPRRIRLDFDEEQSARCDLTGEPAAASVSSFRRKTLGVKYHAVRHPLSPMRRDKPGAEWLFMHPQPGGLSYRDWIDLALSGTGEATNRRPADGILTARDRLRALRLGHAARLTAFGYDMDNMKARGFVEATFPLFVLADADANVALDDAARRLVAGATEVAFVLASAVREALNLDASDVSRLGALREALYAETRASFFEALSVLADVLGKDSESPDALASSARTLLKKSLGPIALAMFDTEAPLDPSLGREKDVQRVIKARLWLWFALEGRGKRGQKLYQALGLAPPETKTSKMKGKGRGGKR
jgi:CRISPR system Cascade subunit CasA